ncbi:hypothetical protein BDK92_2451 [Micromonospora pisi]|uniref:Uncharacterized protein n=1 Tax=Micromonospora pisi TaxID=589240 RepID=A0A495JIC7_9ACTN|nr:DUF4118 domain-containing protein [Micromonospora pisi]RKR88144.1 hypothetical protein BDK92_2451 [Micromonospora pisi]
MDLEHGGRTGRPGVPPAPFGIRIGGGATLVVAATCLAAALFPVSAPLARLLVIVLAVVGFALVVSDLRASLVVGLLGFLCFSGFLLDRYGELHWHGARSAGYLLLLVVAVLLGTALGWVRRSRPGSVAGTGRFHTRSAG